MKVPNKISKNQEFRSDFVYYYYAVLAFRIDSH